MKKTSNYFLPYMRAGMATYAGTVTADGKRSALSVSLDLTGGGQQAPVQLNIGLLGPGDVLGIDRNAIRRTYPAREDSNFNPSYIPFVEFAYPDFLWRYSTRQGGTKKFWMPWLSLIILKNKAGAARGEFDKINHQQADLPQRIQLSEEAVLPNLKEAWRWAHVHTADAEGVSENFIHQKITKTPYLATCRLLSPRRLTPHTAYTAFLVPTFRLGYEAAMGMNIQQTDAGLKALTWETPTAGQGMMLPYYHAWEFRTSERDDFEFLIRQLEFRKLDNVGVRAVDASNPGYGLQNKNNTPIMMEGALRSTDVTFQDWGYDSESGTANPTQKKMGTLLNARLQTVDGEQILRVTPPMYGRWSLEEGLSPKYKIKPSKRNWLSEINLDFRHRYAAGLGAEFVKQNQEKLMESAWTQLKEIRKVNQALNLGKFGRAISNRMYNRIKNLDGNELLQLALPVQTKVPVATAETNSRSLTGDGGARKTLFGVLKETEMPDSLGEVKMKKYMVKKFGKPTKTTAEDTNYVQTMGYVRQSFIPVNETTIVHQNFEPDGINDAVPIDLTTIIYAAVEPPEVLPLGDAVARAIDPAQSIEKRLEHKIKNLRRWEDRQSRYGKPETPMTARSLDDEEPGAPKDPLRPFLWHPVFHQPTYPYLIQQAQELLMPGLEGIPPNTVSFLATNPRFIEAYLVGANHEMAAELRWRNFPTDMRGSYFRKFWDTTIYSADQNERKAFRDSEEGRLLMEQLKEAYPAFITHQLGSKANWNKVENIFKEASDDLDDRDREIAEFYETAIENWLLTRADNKDIEPFYKWTENSRLGSHTLGDQSDEDNQTVLLIRGNILNKFPNMLIYLCGKKADGTPDYKQRVFPIFEANLPPDIELLGFPVDTDQHGQYHLIFEEPLMDLRYGLDENLAPTPEDTEDNVSWQHFEKVKAGKYIDNKKATNLDGQWNDPAYIAKIFTQKSVRVAVELSRFFETESTGVTPL